MANSITGMFKTFYNNYLIDYTNTITCRSGSGSTANLSDCDRATRWISSGSSDIITEYLTVTFNAAQTIDRMLFLNHNFKDFRAFYLSGGVWVDFTSAYTSATTTRGSVYGTGVYGTATYGSNPDCIASADNTETSLYFEFDSVSTTAIRIECTKTIVANAEKYLYELYVGKEIGTFAQDITSTPCDYKVVRADTDSVYIRKSNGGTIKIEKTDKYTAKLALKEVYGTADQTIINTLYDQGQFAILPCGAVPYTQRGMRLIDFYSVVIEGNEASDFSIGRVAAMGLDYTFALREQ